MSHTHESTISFELHVLFVSIQQNANEHNFLNKLTRFSPSNIRISTDFHFPFGFSGEQTQFHIDLL